MTAAGAGSRNVSVAAGRGHTGRMPQQVRGMEGLGLRRPSPSMPGVAHGPALDPGRGTARGAKTPEAASLVPAPRDSGDEPGRPGQDRQQGRPARTHVAACSNACAAPGSARPLPTRRAHVKQP